MEKRYQVFVSSTYADLKDERQHVIQALMEMDCIPAGMELFPAADEEQWEFIKRIIDDCDYYLIIIGGRYGSTTAEGISYTEKEYDYAFEQDLKIIALLHEHPDDIPIGKSEIDPELRIKLEEFREKLTENRLVKFWTRAEELPGIVALSLSKTIKTYPAVGWVRANSVATEDLLGELNEIRKENALLKARISELDVKPEYQIENLATLDEQFTVRGTYKSEGYSQRFKWETTLTWRELFSLISPYLIKIPSNEITKLNLIDALTNIKNISGYSKKLDEHDFQTLTIQFKALGLITTTYSKTTKGGMALFWSLTPSGEKLMVELRTVSSGT